MIQVSDLMTDLAGLEVKLIWLPSFLQCWFPQTTHIYVMAETLKPEQNAVRTCIDRLLSLTAVHHKVHLCPTPKGLLTWKLQSLWGALPEGAVGLLWQSVKGTW